MGLASLAYVVKRLGLRPRDLRRRGVKYRLQSVVFFVQQFCCFNYDFPLYIRGPYSPRLGGDLKLISRLGEEELDLLASQVEAEKAAVIDGVLSAVAGERGAVLEVAATLFELLRVYRGDAEGAVGHLKWIKPWVSDLHVDRAVSLLKRLGLYAEAQSALG